MSARESARSDLDSIELPVHKNISNRNDLTIYDTPEITWEFYNAYHSAKPTRAAFLQGTNSIEDDNLDLFFKSTLSRSKFSNLDAFLAEKPSTAQIRFSKLPHPFNLLCPLQDTLTGKWYDLKKVLHILKLPRDTRLEKATIWEQASAFVIAMIRQRVELFDILQEYHDKGIVHFPTSELIQQAKDIILIGDLGKDMQALIKSRGVEGIELKGYNNSDSDSDYDSDGNRLTIAQKKAGLRGQKKKTSEEVVNETWKGGVTDSLLAHTNTALAADPGMQVPNMQEFETFRSTLLSQTETGKFLPGPKATIMKLMSSQTLLPSVASPGNIGGSASTAVASGLARAEVTLVDPDYVLRSDEEWATDSDEERTVSSSLISSNRVQSAGEKAKGRPSSKSSTSPISRNPSRQAADKPRVNTGTKAAADKPAISASAMKKNASRVGTVTSTETVAITTSRHAQDYDDSGSRSTSPLHVTFDEMSAASSAAYTAEHNASPERRRGPFVLPPGSPCDALDHFDATAAVIVTEGNDGAWTIAEPELSLDIAQSAHAAADDGDGSVGSEASEASLLTQKLRALTPQKDKSKIAHVSSQLDKVMIQLVNAAHAIEKHVERIKDALVGGIIAYNEKLTYEERNLVFDELTALLGDDCPPREGFFDWRSKGVPGMRPLAIRFFCLVHEMATLRLELTELNTPEGRDPADIVTPLDTPSAPWKYNDDKEENCLDTGRWTFIYNGVDVVLKVLHALDFLRSQKEICSWYGRSFYFCANPLMLPFNCYKHFDELEFTDKMKEELLSKPHVRPNCLLGGGGFHVVSTAPGSPMYESCHGNIKSLGASSAWKFEKYLSKWRLLFEQQCTKRFNNWPALPNLKSDEACLALWTSMRVMYIQCKASLVKTYFWETKFISLLSTVRGKDLMMGYSGLKPDLMLDRQTEQRFIEVKELEVIKLAEAEAEKKRKAAAEKENAKGASLNFLSALMAASAGPVKRKKTDKEIAAEMLAVERKLVFQRITTARNIVDVQDPNFEYPFPELFEGYSSVLDNRPPSANDLGFGRSPTRSPTPISRPSSSLLKLRPISERLYSPPVVQPPPVEVKKKKKKRAAKAEPKEEKNGSDEEGEASEEASEEEEEKDESPSKKKRKPKKKKGTKFSLSEALAPGEVLSRQKLSQIAQTSTKISRISAPSPSAQNAPKLTRRVKEDILPPVRRGGGAIGQTLRTPIVTRIKRLGTS